MHHFLRDIIEYCNQLTPEEIRITRSTLVTYAHSLREIIGDGDRSIEELLDNIHQVLKDIDSKQKERYQTSIKYFINLLDLNRMYRKRFEDYFKVSADLKSKSNTTCIALLKKF